MFTILSKYYFYLVTSLFKSYDCENKKKTAV